MIKGRDSERFIAMLGVNVPYASTRALEIGMAMLMVSVGVTLLYEGDTLALPHYAVVKYYMDENTGGIAFVIMGIVRLCALWVNGHGRPTPLIRLMGCAIGCAFWGTMAVAMNTTHYLDLPGLPLMLPVSITVFALEFYSALRCGADASYLGTLRKGAVRNGRI
jgi:hypothetical protein